VKREQGAGRSPAGTDLRVVIGVHDGGISGVNTYAEHVAAAAAAAGVDVTLLATHGLLALTLERRLEGTGVHVVDLGLEAPTAWQRRLERVSPAYAARRLRAAVRLGLPRLGHYDAAHANHPALAAALRPLADRVVVAAWFHPHSALGRAVATWRHTGRHFPRSAALAAKGVLHYRNDVRGYRSADCAVAPTLLLTETLRRAGVAAVQIPPPCRMAAGGRRADRPAASPVRLLVCSGDLGHPRKNVGLAIAAVGLLAGRGRSITLDLVGRNAQTLADGLDRLPTSVDVRRRGPLPPAEVHALMRDADALLLPSLFEEWGYVAVEAALQGTPVVSLPVYPFPEMLAGRLGRCAGGTDARAFADAIDELLADPPNRDQLAASAEERFGVAAVGGRLRSVWEGPTSRVAQATERPSVPVGSAHPAGQECPR
jgi:glycosyltransferase involved in cell wall biosynthesis